jgi:type III restriction enzyme
MEDVNFLCDTIKEKAFDYRIQYPEVPNYITANLRYDLFYWQKEAIEYFLTYQAIKNIEAPDEKTHLMFNMATGTGKTLLMAAMLLYYYKLGYRHFIFFVNQNNIVDKTENNFINSTHIKYLFKDKIIINDKTVN